MASLAELICYISELMVVGTSCLASVVFWSQEYVLSYLAAKAEGGVVLTCQTRQTAGLT